MHFELLRSTDDLADLCDDAREDGRIGIDTEFLWERTYAPNLCLVQLRVGEEICVVDPLDGVGLEPLADLIEDPDVQIIMHAPHADLVAFALRYGCVPTNVFDTQLAAGFAGYSAGLSYERLVQATTGARVKPSESFTDWSRRPLTDNQLVYAAEDVEHLFTMTDAITEKLERLGRTQWSQEELARRFEDPARLTTEPDVAWRKVARRGKLSGTELGVLQAAAAWRESTARRKDLPTGWVMKDATLVEIARRRPKDGQALGKIRGVDGSVKGQDQDRLLEAIASAVKAERNPEPPPPPSHVRRRITVAKGVVASYLRLRCEQLEIAPELVATSSDLEELIAYVAVDGGDHASGEVPALLAGWRQEIVGDELVDLLEGRISLTLTDRDPFMEASRD